jgi:3-hydroxyisobutyrate dehydrogenase
MDVGFVGLGEIGAPMAMRVHLAGHRLIVWNRTHSKMAAFVAEGVEVAGSAREAADRAEVLILCIDSAAGLQDVVLGPGGVLEARRLPRVVVDCSTVHPDLARDLGRRTAEHGAGFVDAPVSGGPRGAELGTLAVFVGGADQDVALARPALDSFGRVSHLGPLGSGQVAKLCNQIVNFATMAALAEATATGRAFGLDADALLAAMDGGLADSAMRREYARGRAAGEHTNVTGIINSLRGLLLGREDGPPGGRIDILLKDLGAAVDVARATGVAAPVTGVLEGVYRILHTGQGVRR